MTQNQIITVTARKNMVRARAGEIQLPKIVGFVFGDGGVDESGNIIPLSETDSTLGNELLRKKYDSYTMVSDTECKYECTLTEEELAGKEISEIACMMLMVISLILSGFRLKARMRILR